MGRGPGFALGAPVWRRVAPMERAPSGWGSGRMRGRAGAGDGRYLPCHRAHLIARHPPHPAGMVGRWCETGTALVGSVLPCPLPAFFFFQPRGFFSLLARSLVAIISHPPTSPLSSFPVLGRFLFSLNKFCGETYGLDVDVGDYHVYEFAKVIERDREREKKKRGRGRGDPAARSSLLFPSLTPARPPPLPLSLSLFHQVWGCSPEAATEIVHAFFASPHFAAGVPPIPGAAAALAAARAYASLAVVTSRQHAIRTPTLAWLDAHFPGLFDGGVHFGNHWAKAGGPAVPKAELCARIGAGVLIDDNPAYATEAAAAGLDVLLYDWGGAYPWAKLGPGVAESHPRIQVVRDWGEAEAALRALAAAKAGAGEGGLHFLE